MDKIKAYVLSGAGDDDVRTWLRDYCGAEIVPFKECNLLVFVGGSDVTPSLYGENNVHSITDYARDRFELDVFNFAKAVGLPMLGICRGAQFLHTMMGGSLWQDVTDHCCQHSIRDVLTGDIIDDTTSTHHQMVRMKWDNYANAQLAGFLLLAEPDQTRSMHYECADGRYRYLAEGGDPFVAEVEAYIYDRDGTSIMGIQGHPEWGGEEFAGWASRRLRMFHGTCSEPDMTKVDALDFGNNGVAGRVQPFDRAAYQADVAAS